MLVRGAHAGPYATLAIIFLLLYFNFRSVGETLIVMLSLPFALVGGIWLLWALGYNWSVPVAIGFIALSGVAAETGVIMLIYLDHAWAVQCVITEHDPPRRKTWETVGAPRLLVIGSYRMGLELMPVADGARLRIFLDYGFALGGLPWLLGHLFGPRYARWCTRRMVHDAASHFATA